MNTSSGDHRGIMKMSDSVITLFAGKRFINVNTLLLVMVIPSEDKWLMTSRDIECIDLDARGRRWEVEGGRANHLELVSYSMKEEKSMMAS